MSKKKKIVEEEEENSRILSTVLIDEILRKEELAIPLKREEKLWYKNIPNVRKAGFNMYEYTEFELEEFIKCSQSVHYFADNYCHIKTESGKVKQMTLRDYQRDFLDMYDSEKYVLLMCSRQMGKTIVSSIYILWFMLFHSDKNVLVYGNTLDTVKANVEKIKDIYLCLPFFMKKGVVNWNEKNISFENNSRLKGVFGNLVGKAIDLLYIDEFAKFEDKDIRRNYGTIIPTISSVATSKIFITSTPDGYNFFWELYTGSLKPDDDESKKPYKIKTVKWYEFPGRRDTLLYYSNEHLSKNGTNVDEIKDYLINSGFEIYVDENLDKLNLKIRFKEDDENTHIKNIRKLKFKDDFFSNVVNKITNWQELETNAIGGEDMFKQEYELEFLSGDKLLFDSLELQKIKSCEKSYSYKQIDVISKRWNLPYNQLKFIDNSELFNLEDIQKYHLIFSVDLAEGLNLDYTVINIFRLVLKSREEIDTNRHKYKSVNDYFKLEQVGIFRSNCYSVDDVAHILYLLAFELCDSEKVRVVLERNKYGEELLLRLPHTFQQINNFSKHIFVRYKNSADEKIPKYGLTVTGGDSGTGKKLLIKDFQDNIRARNINLTEMTTILELSMFGKKETSSGNVTFKAQSGHDDIIMSCINLCSVFKNVAFLNMVEEMISKLNADDKNYIANSVKHLNEDNKPAINYDAYRNVLNRVNNMNNGFNGIRNLNMY